MMEQLLNGNRLKMGTRGVSCCILYFMSVQMIV